MVQKIHPPGCNLGPKYSPPGWSLVRKQNDELAVQYEDVHAYLYTCISYFRGYIHSILQWVESQPDPIVFSILVALYILVSLPIAWGYIVINAATGKVIIHKSCGEQFLWNWSWDLGWFWAGWQYWKKNWADYEQLLRLFFSCFQGQKLFKDLKKIF